MKRTDEQLESVERLLAGLKPAPDALDCDRLMFRAGQASVRSASNQGWKAATGVLAALCLILTAGLTLTARDRALVLQELAENRRAGQVEPVLPTEPEAATKPAPSEPAPTESVSPTEDHSQLADRSETDPVPDRREEPLWRAPGFTARPQPNELSYAYLRMQMLSGNFDDRAEFDSPPSGSWPDQLPRQPNMYEQLQRELEHL